MAIDTVGAEGTDAKRGPKRSPFRMKDVKRKLESWKASHPKSVCILIASFSFIALIGLFAYLVFSGFSSSADFIYNQF